MKIQQLFFFLLHCAHYGILGCQPRIKPRPSAAETWIGVSTTEPPGKFLPKNLPPALLHSWMLELLIFATELLTAKFWGSFSIFIYITPPNEASYCLCMYYSFKMYTVILLFSFHNCMWCCVSCTQLSQGISIIRVGRCTNLVGWSGNWNTSFFQYATIWRTQHLKIIICTKLYFLNLDGKIIY